MSPRFYSRLHSLFGSFLRKQKNNFKFIPNLNRVEIEVTSVCNLGCYNCDRSCSQAPRRDFIKINQIKKFVEESISLGWKWSYIGLLGGEPTLAPNLFQILNVIKKYKKQNQECTVEIVTNGYGPKVNRILRKIPKWVAIRNSKKHGKTHMFEPYNVAPIDSNIKKTNIFENGCKITQRCGLGLTPFGYYPCGAGGAIDRIFGFNLGINKLKDVTQNKMTKKMKILCQYCGHFPYDREIKLVKTQKYSKSWRQAINKFSNKKPTLKHF